MGIVFGLRNRSGKPVWNAADSVHSRFDVVKFRVAHKSYSAALQFQFALQCTGYPLEREHASERPGANVPSSCHTGVPTPYCEARKRKEAAPTTKSVQRPELIGLFWTTVTRAFETSRQ